jgi:hypothetical protein
VLREGVGNGVGGGVVPGGGEFGQVAGFDGEVGEEVEHRPPEAGVDEVRCDVAHGDHHESALVHPGVGNLQRGDVGDEIAVHEEIEVERARAPVHDALAFAVGFDPVQQREDVGGVEVVSAMSAALRYGPWFSGPPTGAVS